MSRTFRATVAVFRVWCHADGTPYTWVRPDGSQIQQMEPDPRFPVLMTKMMREVKKGASLEVSFRKPLAEEPSFHSKFVLGFNMHKVLEVADIVLTWP